MIHTLKYHNLLPSEKLERFSVELILSSTAGRYLLLMKQWIRTDLFKICRTSNENWTFFLSNF